MQTLPLSVNVDERGKPGLAVSALVLGIVAALFVAAPLISAPCAIVAIVHGAKAKRFSNRRGLAVAGFVLGIVAVSLTGLVLLASSSV